MTDELKPVRCGCGGEVDSHLGKYAKWFIACDKCGVRTPLCDSRTEAITVWNRAMGYEPDTFTKDGSIRNPIMWEGMKYGHCVKCDCYCREDEHICSHCGAKLDWSGNGKA